MSTASAVLTSIFTYETESPLIDEKGDPRACEFSYNELGTDERTKTISLCLAVQVTDIFTSVFFAAAAVKLFSVLFVTRDVKEHLGALCAFVCVGSIISFLGRYLLLENGDVDGFDHLNFEKGWITATVWVCFVTFIIDFIFILLNFFLKQDVKTSPVTIFS